MISTGPANLGDNIRGCDCGLDLLTKTVPVSNVPGPEVYPDPVVIFEPFDVWVDQEAASAHGLRDAV